MLYDKLFGTDGIRGQANTLPLIPQVITQIAMAVGQQFHKSGRHKLVVVGKDTRLSGYMIEPALTAGFIAVGLDVVLLGPLPTPAVAFLTRSLRADMGVMISASHNPYKDNGLKFFGPEGYKLCDDLEHSIEEHLQKNLPYSYAPVDDMGRAQRLDDAAGRYIEFVKNTFPKGKRLDGLKIVIDCANGAAYKVAPTILWELGAQIIPLAVTPNGRNINEACGALHPEMMCDMVVSHGAHLGIALDGDADRLVMCDEKGRLVDGDQLIALIAHTWHKAGTLKGGGVVTTIMSNLGLERFLTSQGISLVRTPVGDRHVVTEMGNRNFNVGGEQSGHIILSDHATTGDGLMAALQILSTVIDQQKPVSEILHLFEPVPQILKSFRVTKADILETPQVQACMEAQRVFLGRGGRLLVRKSGTESLIRVMAEGDDLEAVQTAVEKVVAQIQEGD
jgi:phosphoglucosamine mutase